MLQIYRGNIDGEFDYYNLQLPNQSLKFFYNGTDCFTMPASGYKIEKGSFLGVENSFKVTSPEGVQYYFTLKELMDYSTDKTTMKYTDRVYQWLLTKIVLTNQSAINLSYKARHEYWVMSGINEWALDVKFPPTFKGTEYDDSYYSLKTFVNGTPYNWNQMWYRYKVHLLESIESDFGSIHFEYQSTQRNDLPGDFALKSIFKKTNNQVVSARYNLYHNISRSRLLLDSLQLVVNESSTFPSTFFQYNGINLPEPGNTIQDEFGFFSNFPVVNISNDYRNGPTSLPAFSYEWQTVNPGGNYTENLTGVLRTPNLTNCQAMILTAVNYPGGGRKAFFYELNQFNKPIGGNPMQYVNVTGNGLRVSKITESDGAGKTINTHISYENGVCLNNSRQHIFNFIGKAIFIGDHIDPFENLENQPLIFRNATPIKTSPGILPDEVYYGKVIIETRDGAGNNLNGKIIKEFFAEQLKYMSTPNSSNPNKPYNIGICVSRAHYYGLPLKTSYLKREGANYFPIKETVYTYNFYCDPIQSVNNFYARPIKHHHSNPEMMNKDNGPIHSLGYVGPHSMGYFSEPFHLESITTKEWGTVGTGFSVKRQEFEYEAPASSAKHFLPVKVTQHLSQENKITTYINRVAHYHQGSVVHSQATAIGAMKAANQWGTEVEKYSILNEGTPSAVLLGASIREFINQPGLPSLSITSKEYVLKKGISVAAFVPASFSGGTWQKHAGYICESEVKCLDERANTVSLESKKQKSTLLNAPLADLQMAKVSNALNTEIAYAGFEWYESKSMPTIGGNYKTAFGNWVNEHSSLTPPFSTDALFGVRSLALNSSNTLSTHSQWLPANNRKYFLSFWVKGIHPNVSYGASNLTPKVMMSRQGWTLLEYEFTTSSQTLTLSGNCLIDEVRVGPFESSWEFTIYDSFSRAIATGTDKNEYLFTEYDSLGRPYRIKDLEGNILKQSEYIIQSNQN